MSDYPPVSGYSANYGNPDTNSPYPPPSYPNQYLQQDPSQTQTHWAPNYDTSVSAYGYNNSVPPFNPTAFTAGAPSLPFQVWNQDNTHLPHYNPPQSNAQYIGYDNSTLQMPYYPAQQPYQHSSQAQKPYDEGEVSEGDFDDAYGPQNPAPPPVGDSGANYYAGNDGSGYMDTAQRAVYARAQNYSHAQSGRTFITLFGHFGTCLLTNSKRLYFPSRIS
jgi:hypothetical protein